MTSASLLINGTTGEIHTRPIATASAGTSEGIAGSAFTAPIAQCPNTVEPDHTVSAAAPPSELTSDGHASRSRSKLAQIGLCVGTVPIAARTVYVTARTHDVSSAARWMASTHKRGVAPVVSSDSTTSTAAVVAAFGVTT